MYAEVWGEEEEEEKEEEEEEEEEGEEVPIAWIGGMAFVQSMKREGGRGERGEGREGEVRERGGRGEGERACRGRRAIQLTIIFSDDAVELELNLNWIAMAHAKGMPALLLSSPLPFPPLSPLFFLLLLLFHFIHFLSIYF